MTARGGRQSAQFEPLHALLIGLGVLVAVAVVELARGTEGGEALARAMGFAVPFAIVWAALSAWRARR